MSYEEIGNSVTWRETILLIQCLLMDTNSWLYASIAKWEFPVSREWVAITDLYDLTMYAKAKKGKAKPYPRPWPKDNTKRIGKRRQSRDSVLQKLRRMNPKENDG